MSKTERLRILFFCTGNSCRSQMAEGWARHLRDDAIKASSAGLRATEVDPVAMNLMAAAGVDITAQHSKNLAALAGTEHDYVVALCPLTLEERAALEARARLVQKEFDDPPALASSVETEEEAFRHYMRVRDEIRAYVETLPESLPRD